MSYTLTVGLEIHLKIKSATKLFCRCTNNQDNDLLVPNSNVCPVCMGQPGALPVISSEPLLQSLILGRALGCQINQHSSFDRKSYFYPDLPMGYQITQLFAPTCTDGQVTFLDESYQQTHHVHIRDAHMETDTAKVIHAQGESMLDYNRAGTPLVEVVTGPDFHSTAEVVAFLKEMQRIARYNDISDADMEKWQMRADVNISISKTDELGTRVEAKNMNSFSAIVRAIDYEYARQSALLDAGGTVSQETCRWDDIAGQSIVMRSKEDALDYRYFPDPDLPPLMLTREMLDTVSTQSLIIPSLFVIRCRDEFGFHKEYINTLIQDESNVHYFLACLEDGCDPRETVKWMAGAMMAYAKERYLTLTGLPITRGDFVWFLRLVAEQTFISNHYKMIMESMLEHGWSAEEAIARLSLTPKASGDEGDELLMTTIQSIVTANPWVVEQYRAGKESAIGFFVGQVMKQMGGKVDPVLVKAKLEEELKR